MKGSRNKRGSRSSLHKKSRKSTKKHRQTKRRKSRRGGMVSSFHKSPARNQTIRSPVMKIKTRTPNSKSLFSSNMILSSHTKKGKSPNTQRMLSFRPMNNSPIRNPASKRIFF